MKNMLLKAITISNLKHSKFLEVIQKGLYFLHCVCISVHRQYNHTRYKVKYKTIKHCTSIELELNSEYYTITFTQHRFDIRFKKIALRYNIGLQVVNLSCHTDCKMYLDGQIDTPIIFGSHGKAANQQYFVLNVQKAQQIAGLQKLFFTRNGVGKNINYT